MTLTGVSVSSQSLPIQTRYQGENAVIISEAQMDNLSLKVLELALAKNKLATFQIQFNLLQKDLALMQSKSTYLEALSNSQADIITSLQEVAQSQDRINEAEQINLKQKNKNKWVSYLVGFAVGATAVLVLN